MRRLMAAVLLAVALVAGMVGYALADIPDTEPSAPDFAHTLHFCVKEGVILQVPYAFDRSLAAAQGKPTCAQWLGTGYKDVPVVPAVPPTSP
jgi:hypothetical protein